jgi:hypothetical protein
MGDGFPAVADRALMRTGIFDKPGDDFRAVLGGLGVQAVKAQTRGYGRLLAILRHKIDA